MSRTTWLTNDSVRSKHKSPHLETSRYFRLHSANLHVQSFFNNQHLALNINFRLYVSSLPSKQRFYTSFTTARFCRYLLFEVSWGFQNSGYSQKHMDKAARHVNRYYPDYYLSLHDQLAWLLMYISLVICLFIISQYYSKMFTAHNFIGVKTNTE